MTNSPLISIIILVRNGEADILGAIENVGLQDYSPIEVLVVDGMSTDGTRSLVEAYARKEQRFAVRLLNNPGLIQSSGWNVGIRESSGPFVVRVDAVHCRIQQPNYLRTCLEKLLELRKSDSSLAAVGGRREPIAASSNPWSEAIALAQRSGFGVGNATYRLGTKEGFADLISVPVYERGILFRVGLFDESLGRSEDNEFHARLREQGYKLYFVPEALVTYHPRNTLAGIATQMFHNGWWVSATIVRKGKFPFGLRHLVPFGFYVSLLTLGVLSFLDVHLARTLFLGIIGTYAVGSLVAALLTARSASFWRLLVVFWLMHSWYAAGTLTGFFAGRGDAAKGQLTAPGANPVKDAGNGGL
jgi:glycosyltransferase involved in cell wall biosynthesis